MACIEEYLPLNYNSYPRPKILKFEKIKDFSGKAQLTHVDPQRMWTTVLGNTANN